MGYLTLYTVSPRRTIFTAFDFVISEHHRSQNLHGAVPSVSGRFLTGTFPHRVVGRIRSARPARAHFGGNLPIPGRWSVDTHFILTNLSCALAVLFVEIR